MTGTAKSSEEEFHDVYNMLVFAIPTNMPVIRIDSPDVVYGTKELKYAAIVEEVRKRHAKGQPILLGTIAVETSELLSKRLDAAGIPHEVLNAKNNEREAEIIAKAGQMGAVTIATNMAGRGTDIKLGEGVPELGGLCVIGSERHESPRIDNQLRGRSGRQGDPGYSCFFVSLEDNLMRRFGSERLEGLFQTIGSDAITSKTITKAIDNAQMRVEGLNYDARKTMLQYDDVLREQRENLYDQRNLILDQKQVRTVLEKMYEKSIRNVVEVYWPLRKEEGPEKESAYRSFCTLGLNELAKDSEMDTWSAEDAAKVLTSRAWKLYCDRTDVIKDEMYQFERQITLTCIDEHWTDHLSVMSKLRDGIGLRSYAQDNPLQAYVKEGFNLYERMLDDIAFEVTGYCAGVHVEVQQQPAVPQAVPAPSAAA
jgi:preprotein translocase subunit SecA